MAIKHNIPIVPISFLDCKKRFSWTFFSGGPGILRVKEHHFVDAQLLGVEDTSTLREEVRETVLNELLENS
jgi:1-acyl-sn-glycerol-3-phosphate acyltransferase